MMRVARLPTRLATAAAAISLLATVGMTAGAPRVAASVTLPDPITAPSGAVRTMAIPDSALRAVADRAVYHVPFGGVKNRLFVADLTARTEHRVSLPLLPHEEIASVATDGQSLVLLVWQRINPSPPTGRVPCEGDESHPLTWRLLAAPLSHGLIAGSFRVLDSGRSVLVFRPAHAGEYCDGPLVPQLAVASGRVAYAIEHMTSAQPTGARIVVRSLASSAIVRTVTRPWQVVALALSDSTLAWTESANTHGSNASDLGWAVRRASLTGGASVEVNLGSHSHWRNTIPDPLALDGSALVLAVPDSAGDVRIVERITASGTVAKLNPPQASWCSVEGAAGATVAISCGYPGRDAEVFMLWRSGHGAHPLFDLSSAVLGPTSLAWTLDSSGVSVVRLADLSWP